MTASTRRDGEELLRDAAAAGVRVETETFPLSEANRALGRIKEGKMQAAGVLLVR